MRSMAVWWVFGTAPTRVYLPFVSSRLKAGWPSTSLPKIGYVSYNSSLLNTTLQILTIRIFAAKLISISSYGMIYVSKLARASASAGDNHQLPRALSHSGHDVRMGAMMQRWGERPDWIRFSADAKPRDLEEALSMLLPLRSPSTPFQQLVFIQMKTRQDGFYDETLRCATLRPSSVYQYPLMLLPESYPQILYSYDSRWGLKTCLLQRILNHTVTLWYEYFITLDDEVKFFWGRKRGAITILFFVNRYLPLLGEIIILVHNFVPLPENVRNIA